MELLLSRIEKRLDRLAGLRAAYADRMIGVGLRALAEYLAQEARLGRIPDAVLAKLQRRGNEKRPACAPGKGAGGDGPRSEER